MKNDAKKYTDDYLTLIEDLHAAWDATERGLADEYRPWAVNWSLSGCMPGQESDTFETETEAREALASDMREMAEEWAEDERFGPVAAGELQDAAGDIESGSTESVVLHGHHFWVTRDETGGLGPDDLDAFRALVKFRDEHVSPGTELTDVDAEDVIEAVQEMPLEVAYRSGWGNDPETLAADEWRILLTVGGPYLALRGEIGGTPEWDCRCGGDNYRAADHSDAVAWFVDLIVPDVI